MKSSVLGTGRHSLGEAIARLNARERSYIAEFEKLLLRQGYSQDTLRRHVRLVCGFCLWLQNSGRPLRQTNVATIHGYLCYRSRYRGTRRGDLTAIISFIKLLQELDVVYKKNVVKNKTYIEQLVDKYTAYLAHERRLSSDTIKNYTNVASRFLKKKSITAQKNLLRLDAKDIIRFVQSESLALRAMNNVAVPLRSFLQYVRFEGYIARDLSAAVPKVANWRSTSIPEGVSPENTRRVLASCKDSANGTRDYAMMLLIVHLGLRSCEVARLTLDDIDWHAGTLTVRAKGIESKLPLITPVGKAIATYLRRGRPRCESRRVFISAQAPVRGFSREAVKQVVRRAFDRAGIDSPRKGPHQFRHALATKMLQRGHSLAEIGEILRHKDPESSMIYAKVDVSSLRDLAPRWPGSRA